MGKENNFVSEAMERRIAYNKVIEAIKALKKEIAEVEARTPMGFKKRIRNKLRDAIDYLLLR